LIDPERGLRRWRAVAVIATAGLIALAAGRAAADCDETPFPEQVAAADVIFAGTMDHVRVEHSTLFAGSYSLLTFRDVVYAKGKGPAGSLTISQPGVVGLMADWPGFEPGVRYVAFATEGETRGSGKSRTDLEAMSCTRLHPFSVRADSTGREVVRDVRGRIVLALGQNRIVLLAEHPWDPAQPWVERDSTGAPIKPPLAGHWLDGSVEVQVVWPDRDPGTRVGEADLIAWLRGVERGGPPPADGPSAGGGVAAPDAAAPDSTTARGGPVPASPDSTGAPGGAPVPGSPSAR
jgi:hypothetical protein